MSEPVRRSPLSHRHAIAAADGALRMRERPFLAKFVLRGPADALGPAVAESLGAALPAEPLTSSDWGEGTILWLGPDEWMLVGEGEAADRLGQKLGEALVGGHHQLVDVSDYYTLIELAGAPAWQALSKATTLDLHPRAFPVGMVAGGTFGHAQATIWRPRDEGDTPEFRLFVRWSMADYLWCLLAECGREWGLPAEKPVSGERLTIG